MAGIGDFKKWEFHPLDFHLRGCGIFLIHRDLITDLYNDFHPRGSRIFENLEILISEIVFFGIFINEILGDEDFYS